MDAIDKVLVNQLQDGIEVCQQPFAKIAAQLNISETDVVRRLRRMREDGVLSRFGPMYHAERMGGSLTLAAIKVPAEDFDRVADIVNSFEEVAHNYEREHEFNMWFVVATEKPEQIADVIEQIEAMTGLRVYNMPKEEEFYVGLRFEL
ncbi:MAG: Lrp/AsnC family transcriptional regulator [Hahellaceae bacterium]|nr:Lrp/AsnC family transcriptional regulator [Hahellaceae bacterium]MCP5212569.1 Lrp/AsnC family transcriptional regulator [Hahellaceae bacterium]